MIRNSQFWPFKLHTNQPNFTSVLNEEKPTNLIAEEEGGAPTEWVCGHWLRVVGDLHAADVTPSLVLQQNAAQTHSIHTQQKQTEDRTGD